MPQNLKTAPESDDDELPLLSAEEEALVEAIAAGHGNAEAYRIAYRADGYSPNALAVAASRKINSPKIQRHLRALQATGLAKTSLTRDARIKDRLAFAARAERAGNFGAANGAHDAVDKMLGHMIDRVADVTASDPMQTLKDIAQHQPDLAASLAAQAGIPWDADQDAKSTRH